MGQFQEYAKSTLAASIRNSERALKALNEIKAGVPLNELHSKLTNAIAHVEVAKQETERALRIDAMFVNEGEAAE